MRRKRVRVAIVGVGNCASSFVQGIEFYKHASDHEYVPGIMHVNLGGYHIRDIEFSAAFDVNAAKVGLDLSEAIMAKPNNTITFAQVPQLDVPVMRGPTMDGIGRYLKHVIHESTAAEVNVADVLRESATDVVISYLPVGSQKAAEWYAHQVLEAGCGYVNCMPVFIASNQHWLEKFENRGLPIIGDDVKSQVGATITHRMLTNLFRERGVRLDRTYQLNVGGNTDFMNMLERERLESKKISKTNAIRSQMTEQLPDNNIHIGPSDYVPWLDDRKVCYIRMEGTTFGNVPLSCEMRMEVWDSPNSAGVVIDAVRCVKLAMDRGIGGALIGPSSYFMKSPPQQFTDHEARLRLETFIQEMQAADGEPLRIKDKRRSAAHGRAAANGDIATPLEAEISFDPAHSNGNGNGRSYDSNGLPKPIRANGKATSSATIRTKHTRD
jgi:myo-inositol-1-phosphate synthase